MSASALAMLLFLLPLAGAAQDLGAVRLQELTLERMARLQQQWLEAEAVRKAGLVAAPAPSGAAAGLAAAAIPDTPPRVAPPRRSFTLLGVVAAGDAVRHAELLFEGAVVPLAVGQSVGGWRLVAATPAGVRLAAGRRVLEVRPGQAVEVR